MRTERMIFVIVSLCLSLIGCTSSSNTVGIENNIDYSDRLIYFYTPLDDPLSLSASAYETFVYNGVPVIPVSNLDDIPLLGESTSSGTGFFVAPDLLITNQHVIDSADVITVVYKGQDYIGDVMLSNEEYDIALIRTPFTVDSYFDFSNQYSLASDIYVLGYPLSDLLGSDVRVTTGSISSMSGLDGDTNFVQISAPIQPGNSGGPVIDEEFKVIGMATSSLSDLYLLDKASTVPQNVNFAIKSQLIELIAAGNIISEDDDSNYVDSLDDAVDATAMIKSENLSATSSIDEQYLFTLDYSYSSAYSFFIGTRTYYIDQATMRCIDLRTGKTISAITKFRSDYGATISNAGFIDRLTADLLTNLGV